MSETSGGYFSELIDCFGDCWNRFWFTPSDPARLGPIRACAGLLALYIVATYGFDLDRFFGPRGWLPVSAVTEMEGVDREGDAKLGWKFAFSYLNHCKTPAELRAAHIAGCVVLGMLALGLFSRVTSVLGAIVVLSYVHRAPMLTGSAEAVLTMVLVYLCLGPSGASFSLDRLFARWRARRQGGSPQALTSAATSSLSATIAVRLIQVHLALIVAVMGLSKLTNDTWWGGLGPWWLMTRSETRWWDLTGLHTTPYLVNFWSHATVAFELAFPVLIWNRLARPLLLGLAVVIWGLLIPITGQATFVLALWTACLAFLGGPLSVIRGPLNIDN